MTTSVASADSDSDAACQAGGYGQLCLWSGGSMEGTMWAFRNEGSWYFVGTANDQAASLWNYRNEYVTWVGKDWINGGPGSDQACIPTSSGPNAEFWAELGNLGIWPADNSVAYHTISSYYLSNWRTTCPYNTELLLTSGPDSGDGGPD